MKSQRNSPLDETQQAERNSSEGAMAVQRNTHRQVQETHGNSGSDRQKHWDNLAPGDGQVKFKYVDIMRCRVDTIGIRKKQDRCGHTREEVK